MFCVTVGTVLLPQQQEIKKKSSWQTREKEQEMMRIKL